MDFHYLMPFQQNAERVNAALDRLTHHAYTLVIRGDNFRFTGTHEGYYKPSC